MATERRPERAVLRPADAAAHRLALEHVARGELAAARTAWEALLSQAPQDRLARYHIGLTWHDAGELERAAHWYRQQVTAFPESLPAWHNLGLCLYALRDFRAAAKASRAAVRLDSGHYAAWLNLAASLNAEGDLRGAVDCYREASRIRPQEVEPLERAAAALGAMAELPAAIALLDEAIQLEPGRASLWWARAAHRSSLGRHRLALEDMRRALALSPDDSRGHSALLMELQYDTTLATRVEAAAEHRRWTERHGARPSPVRVPARAPRRAGTSSRLRIGCLSPRFGAGPLASFFLPVLEHQDRCRVDILLYSAFRHDDAVAARMRSLGKAWRELPADDDEAAAQIAADRLDLLIDLAGHTPGGRLPVLARRPAPVQATWLDYADTTGLPQIDYLLSDAIHTPAEDAAYFTERLVLLTPCRFVYAPPAGAHASPVAADAGARITFGCFNRHAKISDDAVRLWAALLERLPASRLVLRASAYGGAGTVTYVREHWARLGLPVDRVELLPYVPLAEALKSYDEIDIALDPFPYNGGVTTCDALAMGVPVVALLGTRMIGRQSAALLHAAGRPEWIATTEDEYLDIAVGLARSAERPELRMSLGREVRASPLCRAQEFTATFERACARMVEVGPRPATASEPLVIAG
jgi:predicted O-linked N-acetylglucosamine transferase (SPINDLY family)